MRRMCLSMMLAACAASASAADITVNGAWWQTLNRSDLIGSVGTDLVSSIESAPAATTLTIANTNGLRWRVEVTRAVDANWPPGVELAIRCGAESGINAGATYLKLTSGAQALLEGSGDHANIQMQFKLEGASVDTLSATYNLVITYTLVPVSS